MSKEPIHPYYFYALAIGQALCVVAIIANYIPLMFVGALIVIYSTIRVLAKHRRNVS